MAVTDGSIASDHDASRRCGRTRPIAEIAAAEKIDESHVGRVLRLTLLAPDVVEAILDGRQPPEITLAVLMRPFAVAWTE
jgi:hypothetical protein